MVTKDADFFRTTSQYGDHILQSNYYNEPTLSGPLLPWHGASPGTDGGDRFYIWKVAMNILNKTGK
jgi:hypothetical protein